MDEKSDLSEREGEDKHDLRLRLSSQNFWAFFDCHNVSANGWNPELVLLSVVLPNSTNLAEVIPNRRVFGTLYAI